MDRQEGQRVPLPLVLVLLPLVPFVDPAVPMPVLLVLLPGVVAVVDGLVVVELEAPMLVPVPGVVPEVRVVDWHPAASAVTTTTRPGNVT